MANTPGMFTGFNKYEAELIDAAKQREASSADVGTGWQAMTQASGRAGGMIGRTVGKALGGVTTAEQRLQDFQAITATMPNFDFNNVEDLQEMSSKLWQGGFYDQGKELMDTANIYQRNLAEVANIEEQTAASEAVTELEQNKFDLSKKVSEAQIKEIQQQILNLKSDVKVDDQQIKESQQNIKQSEALVKDLSLTDQAKNFEFAQENGNYTGTFADYQELVANLKTVAKEGSINLFEYAQTPAGGSYTGTLEDFVTSVTGVDYKEAKAASDASKDDLDTGYYTMSGPVETKLVNYLKTEIDQGFFSRRGDKLPPTDVEMTDLADKLFQIAKNTGKTPAVVWNHYGRDIDYIMDLSVTRSLKPYGEKAAGQGGSDDDESGLRVAG